jgi:hypothetical protein
MFTVSKKSNMVIVPKIAKCVYVIVSNVFWHSLKLGEYTKISFSTLVCIPQKRIVYRFNGILLFILKLLSLLLFT